MRQTKLIISLSLASLFDHGLGVAVGHKVEKEEQEHGVFELDGLLNAVIHAYM